MRESHRIRPASAYARGLAALLVLSTVTKATHGSDEGGANITGDPYDLPGHRIVFTDWFYVRPGMYAWTDAEGNRVTARTNASLGPWDAQFETTDIPRGIRIVAQPAERRGPIIADEPPWDRYGLHGGTLLQDNGRFRLWAFFDLDGKRVFCVFESEDGHDWKKPVLNILEHEGSTANNLIPDAPRCVFVDPSAPDTERYKGVSIDHRFSREYFEAFRKRRPDAWEHRADRGEYIFGIAGFTSPDGIVWSRLPDPLAIEHSDTDITAYYDPERGKYVMYTRNYYIGPQSKQVAPLSALERWLGDFGGAGRRAIGRTESDRFDAFPLSKLLVVPDPGMRPSEVFYTNCRTTVPGAPDQHLMFPAVWDTATDTTRIVMKSSHGGEVWNGVPGGDVLRTATFGEWDGGCIFAFPQLVELPDGSFALPYKGFNFPHKYPRGQWKYGIGLAVWPKGRMVALESPDRGEFATVRIMPPGRKLLINAVTERVGSILVEVAGPDGKPLPGHAFADAKAIRGDQYQTPLQWGDNQDLGFNEGEPIILRFRMDRAKIFSLDFRP